MKLEKEFKVGIRDIGINNRVTNKAFLGFFEEIGCLHSDLVGYGINDIKSTKKAWLLMDWKLRVIERPQYGADLLVKTWARELEKNTFYSYRDFEVYYQNKRIAVATSKWVLFDTEQHKISKITNDIYSLYNPENTCVFEEKDLSKIKELENYSIVQKYVVQRSDIDINKHMHNLNYLNVAYEVLPEKEYNAEEKMNTRIMYKHQILLGEKVKSYYAMKDNKDIIVIKSEDDSILHAIIELY